MSGEFEKNIIRTEEGRGKDKIQQNINPVPHFEGRGEFPRRDIIERRPEGYYDDVRDEDDDIFIRRDRRTRDEGIFIQRRGPGHHYEVPPGSSARSASTIPDRRRQDDFGDDSRSDRYDFDGWGGGYVRYEHTPEDLGRAAKAAVLDLLLRAEFPPDDAIVLQRTNLEKSTNSPLTFAIDMVLSERGISRLLRMGFEGQEGLTTLTSQPIPLIDYPKYTDLAKQVVGDYSKAKAQE